MSVDPDYAAHLTSDGDVVDPAAFAAQERAILARTNAFRVRSRGVLHDLGWPSFFGTSPWGALEELEWGTGRRYGVVPLRFGDDRVRARAYDEVLLSTVRSRAPALLYVGDRVLPRHVTLLSAGEQIVLYEPAAGAVVEPRRERFTSRSLALGGWDVPWFALVPR